MPRAGCLQVGETFLHAATTELFFRYRLTGTNRLRLALVNSHAKTSRSVELNSLTTDRWAETTVKPT